jgi:hypothetical protein
MTEDQMEALLDAQEAYIVEHFNDRVVVNYGWGTTDEGVASKIYLKGILSSSYDEHGQVVHSFEAFA